MPAPAGQPQAWLRKYARHSYDLPTRLLPPISAFASTRAGEVGETYFAIMRYILVLPLV